MSYESAILPEFAHFKRLLTMACNLPQYFRENGNGHRLVVDEIRDATSSATFRWPGARKSRRWWSGLGRAFYNLVRSLLFFLLGASIVFLLIAHRKEIARKFNGVVSTVQKKNTADPIRKTALDYEHEVDDVTK